MRASTHAPVGAALVIWLLILNPALAFALGLGSHLALDSQPHWDPGHWVKPKLDGTSRTISEGYGLPEKIVMYSDAGLTLVLSIWILAHHPLLSVLCGMIGAVLPDVFVVLPKLYARVKTQLWLRPLVWFHQLHQAWHFRIERYQRKWSFHLELIILVVSLWWLGSR